MQVKRDYDVLRGVWDAEYTVTRQLHRNCLKWPDRVAIIDPFRGRDLTYRQWDEEANQFANALLDAGVTDQECVMGDLFNTYEWFVLHMGSAKARRTFHSMNYMLPEGQVSRLMDDSPVGVFVYDAELRDTALEAIESAQVRPKVCVMCGPGEPPEGHVSCDKFIEGHSTAAPDTEKDVSWLDPVLGLYTSGTTVSIRSSERHRYCA